MQRTAHNAMKKRMTATLALWLALTLSCVAGAESVTNVTVNAAPLTTVSTAVDGMVRVYLSSLGTPSTLTLTIAGSYSLSTGDSLTSGETLTLGFSSATGAITLTRNGVKTNMGTYFSLRRHSASGSNGILIAQGRKPTNPYPGDMSFEAVKQSSGSYKLYTVAHIYLESYLYGVLPYEMGSSAPAEALKAQAVAARTYTVRMMANRASGYYDVVDTTGDQVYNGTPSGYATCVAAVDATKGVVLKNSGSYTATYYSASNGGQTESIYNIWGTSGYGYLSVKDDPFDYANPDSTVKKTTVSTDLTSASNNASLISLLKTKAVSALSSSGYAATSANTSLASLKSVVVHTPMYASPSKLYTKMDFTLTATTQNTAGASISATTTVTCGIFTELESLLGMSIQSSKNELWSVTKSGSSYILAARRYGHGLGMSQRGAMYMGKLGYTYDEILGFYFTDSTRVGCTFTNTILAAGSSDVITTEETSAGISDSSSDGTTVKAIVKLVSSNGALAIRAQKSTSGAILGVVSNSSPVTLYMSDGTWCLIGFGGIRGYVPVNALTITGTPAASSDVSVTSISGFATVKASGYLNLRSSGSSSASILTTAPTGAVLTVFSKTSGWANVQYGATVAYASTDFLTFSDTYPSTVVSTGSGSATVTADDGGTVALRATASTSGTVLAQLASGVTVTVTRDDGSWASVEFSGMSGYVLSASIAYADGLSANTGSSDSGTTSSSGEVSATVSTATAVLRASADESGASVLEIAMGQSVVVIDRGTTWSTVRYEGTTGYMLTACLAFSDTSASGVSATVATQSGSLNMRQEARAGSTILTTIPQYASVTVTSRGETWSAVTYNGLSGYVMTSFLSFADDTASDTVAGSATTATVTTASGSLNLRQEGKAGSTILRTIPRLATVSVSVKGVEWSCVTYEGTTGYVMSAFLTFATETAATAEPTATPTPDVTVTAGTDATPTPTAADATATPTPTSTDTAGTLTAIVTTTSGSLNLRADMLPGSRILTRIPNGTTIVVINRLSAWSQTSYGGYTGYVLNSYLTFPAGATTTATDSGSSSGTLTATVLTASGSLNLRAEPYGTILTTLPQYATVQVTQKGSDWCYLSYNGVNGYAMTAYLSFATTTVSATATPTATPTDASLATADASTIAPTATPTPAPTTDQTVATTWSATVTTPSGSLNLRASASASAQILTTLPRLATVTVTEKGADWCKVLYGGLTGYAMTTYLSFADTTAATATPTTAPTETASATAAVQGVYAWVYTASGSLNLRASASSSAAILVTIPRLSQVTLLTQGAVWTQVQYNGTVGYAMSAYLTTTKPAELTATSVDASDSGSTVTATPATTAVPEDPTLTAPESELYAYVTPINDGATHPLYGSCSESTIKMLDMIRNSMVQIIRKGDTWCEVLYFSQTGFCLTEGLTLIGQ